MAAAATTKAKDAARAVVDGLKNLVTGMGVSGHDKNVASRYTFTPLDDAQLEAAYRSDWVARKGVTIPAEDSTREWRAWQADKDDITKIEEVERQLDLQRKVKRAILQARLYGGAALLLGLDDGLQPNEPFDPERANEKTLKYVHVVSRRALIGREVETDPESALFGLPKMYQLTGSGSSMGAGIDVHPSRLVRFVGNEFPDNFNVLTGAEYLGWGDSILNVTDDAIKNVGVISSGTAQLVTESKLDVIRVPQLSNTLATEAGTNRVSERFQLMNLMKSIYGMILLDEGEAWERKEANFAHLPDMMNLYLLVASGAFDVPATRFLGQSPKGMNSTGESDLANYYDSRRSYQHNDLGPALRMLDDLVILRALGKKPDGIFFDWRPLWQMSEKDEADIALKKAQVFQIDVASGVFPSQTLRDARGNQLIEDGTYPGFETALDEGIAAEEADVPENNPNVQAQMAAMLRSGQGNPLLLPAPGGNRKDPSLEFGAWTGGKGSGAEPDGNNAVDRRRGADAKPRTLYVRRDVTNPGALRKWARDQGFKNVVDDMHVTVMHASKPVDWMRMGEAMDETEKVRAGGPRAVEPLGDKGAVALLFSHSGLSWRHESMAMRGAVHDHEEFTPHVTVSWDPGPEALAKLDQMEPYRGPIELGPEVFEEVKGG